MTGLRLTPERRDQLAALLANDAAGLNESYPHLAEYLRTSERLPGSGDPEADNAFDLRILHFMTGGDSTNPYWDIVAPAVTPTEQGRYEVNAGNPNGSARLRYAQELLQAAFAYPIPSPATLTWAAAMTEGRPVIEIGAGRGYWAHWLARASVHINAYDSHPPGDHTRNTWFPPVAGLPHQWHPVGSLRDLATANRTVRHTRHTEHVLFLCWPPAWEHPMARNALAAYERLGGQRLIYIGEPQGGMCADDHFFDGLHTRWHLASQHPDHITWWNLNDVAQCWECTT